ncbi:MAG: aminopeptidase [Spirochaetes bacterium]|nr:aminopeptidase [Spirochaetota bacterium]MBU0953971.1 aminopeptidase [Spirochaetota bacterium]
MIDTRAEKLAHILVNYSLEVKAGENVLVQATGYEPAFDRALIRAIHAAGGRAFVTLRDKTVDRELLMQAAPEQVQLQAELELERMKKMQCFIGYSAIRNMNAMSDVPGDKMDLYNRNIWKKVHIEQRLPHTRWVVLRYPTAAMAQMANMSEEAFEEFYFKVCTMDYAKMSKAMDSLVALMAKTDKVRLVARDTDLAFSIKGLPPVKCDGKLNIPDGEVYSAPVKNSVNGVISYNTPSEHEGFTYENIRFEFKDGKIIKASSNDTTRINRVLDTDEGARYVGEFAIGVNPYITKAMKETLFDEKIAGSIHFTPGNSYDDCFNGNRSAVHWDLVLIQTPDFGGGEIWFDDRLIRKDGLFVIPELLCLNPDQLK